MSFADEPPPPPNAAWISADDFQPRKYSWRPSARAWLISGGLFLLTCVTTFFSGIEIAGPHPGSYSLHDLFNGLSYAIPVMAILLCHEMGHYLQSVRHGVPATLPIFIPTPPGIGMFGTMGAVIVQAAGYAHRRALFDIAVSGPIAGLIVAVPVAWFGIQQSVVKEFIPAPGQTYFEFGDPLLLKAMVWLKHGALPPHHDVVINPLLFAGWVGFFLTGLNLMPIGQLDGGHVLYTLIGRRAHVVAMLMWGGLVLYLILAQYVAFGLMLVLLAVMGLKHPPTANDRLSLGWGRTLVGWGTMALLLVCFTPRPIVIHFPTAPPPAAPPIQHPADDELMVRAFRPEALHF